MKKLFLSMVLLLSAQFCFGQALELKSVGVGIGKSATSSGYDVTLGFSNGTNDFSVVGNHQRVYGTFSIPLGIDILDFTATGGFFKNCPWFGPMITLKPTSFLLFMHWSGFGFGHPDYPAWDMHTLVMYHAATASYLGVSVTYALCRFDEGHTDKLPGIRYDGNLNNSWRYFVSADYSVDGKEPLFMFGMKHTF